jgi:hypothetical protein
LQSKIKIGSRKLKIGCGKPKTGVEKLKTFVEHKQTAYCILKHRDRKPNEGAHRSEPTRERVETSRSQFSASKHSTERGSRKMQGPQQAVVRHPKQKLPREEETFRRKKCQHSI